MKLAADLSARLPDIASQVALPALLGGAGGGALAGYMSAKAHPDREDPGMRRKRIIRNALTGVLLGGTAGATLPLGVKTLGGELLGPSKRLDPAADLLGLGLQHAAPLGVGAGGLGYMHMLRGKEKTKALAQVFSQLKDQNIAGTKVNNIDVLRQVLESGGRENVLKLLARGGKDVSFNRLLKGHELLGEAGYKGNILESLMSKKTPTGYLANAKTKVNVADLIRKYIQNTSGLPEALKPYGPAGLISKSVGGDVLGHSTTPIAEAYLQLVRPSVKRMLGRSGNLTRLGLLGGGVWGAHELQKALMGQD